MSILLVLLYYIMYYSTTQNIKKSKKKQINTFSPDSLMNCFAESPQIAGTVKTHRTASIAMFFAFLLLIFLIKCSFKKFKEAVKTSIAFISFPLAAFIIKCRLMLLVD